MSEVRFFRCKHCGNLVGIITGSGVPLVCCGEEMEELVAGTVEASREKHIPVISRDGNRVIIEVGSVAHPMIAAHYIEWIFIQTKHGGQRKRLSPNDAPKATFLLDDDELVAAYAYCNLHGLWKADA